MTRVLLTSAPSLASGLSCRLSPPGDVVSALGLDRYLLGVVRHGSTGSADGDDDAYGDAVVARTPMEPLDASWVEVFETSRPSRRSRVQGIEIAEDGAVLFGSLEIADGKLEAVTQDAFTRLLRVSRDRGYPHPLRIWVSIPGINRSDDGLERYQSFCRGRSLAFEAAHGSGFAQRLCASSAVGSDGGPVSIYFLASKEIGTHCENPRQLAAYRYPPEYGPRSPSFARATVAPKDVGGGALIAGTASIVGHENQHPGDVVAQLHETIRNLDALVESLPIPPRVIGSPRAVKVYVRRAADLSVVRSALRTTAWGVDPVLYLRADICREPLLLEIEAIA